MSNILMEALRALREDAWDFDDLDPEEQEGWLEGACRKAAAREAKAEKVAPKILSSTAYKEEEEGNLEGLLYLSSYDWHDVDEPDWTLSLYQRVDNELKRKYPELIYWRSSNEDDFGDAFDEIWHIDVILKDNTVKKVSLRPKDGYKTITEEN